MVFVQETFLLDIYFFQVLEAFSDGLYASPAIFSAGTFVRKSKNTFFYHFTHHTKMGAYGQVSLHIYWLQFREAKKQLLANMPNGLLKVC